MHTPELQISGEQQFEFTVQLPPWDAQLKIVTDFVYVLPTRPVESFGWTKIVLVPAVVYVYDFVKTESGS